MVSHERGPHADWIPEYLQPAAKNSLRAEMQKARAASDVDGYIYTFEILGMALSTPRSCLIELATLRAQIPPTRRPYT